MTDRTAVVIVGAGPAGLMLGNLLRAQGIDMLVPERATRERAGEREGGRLTVVVRRTAAPPEVTVSGRWIVDPAGPSDRIEGADQFPAGTR